MTTRVNAVVVIGQGINSELQTEADNGISLS